MQIAGYHILETLYESEKTRIFLGIDPESKSKVTLKVAATNFPRKEDFDRLEYEYEITQSLEMEGIIKPISLQRSGFNYVLVREYFEGQNLKELREKYEDQRFPLEDFFRIAIKVSELLGELHDKGIIHRDINPNNLIYQASSETVKILDFGIASRINTEARSHFMVRQMEGTLPYLSPEQSGRMNHVVDFRSDLYSLGITFYEMLSGHRPFDSEDPNEILYGHMAKAPVSLHRYQLGVPEMVESILFKLLAKMPEDRYQSAGGLRSDLERCYEYYNLQGEIPYFEMGQFDFSRRLMISSKLYGRKLALSHLEQEVKSASRKGFYFFVARGPKGIGKTTFLQATKRHLDLRGGALLEATFSQAESDVPFSSWRGVFIRLVEELMKKDDKVLANIQQQLYDEIGDNLRVLSSLIPNLDLLTGELEEVPALPPSESQLRFNFVFRSFIKIISKKFQPLLFLLDDLHEADSASLYLLDIILEDASIDNLMIVASYSSEQKRLPESLKNLEKKYLEDTYQSHLKASLVDLEHLSKNDIQNLLQDSLKIEEEVCQKATQILFNKTQGNPYFIHQLLEGWYDAQIIQFDNARLQWKIDQFRAQQWTVTDNVLHLLMAKVDEASYDFKVILGMLASLEQSFNWSFVKKVLDREEDLILESLVFALHEGIIECVEGPLPIKNVDQWIQRDVQMSFVHESLAKELVDGLDKSLIGFIHFQAGMAHWEEYEAKASDEKLFLLLRHLNRVSAHVEKNKKRLAELNFLAGQKSKEQCNYISAISFFTRSLQLASDEKAILFNIELALLETLYLAGKFEDLDKRYDQLIAQPLSNEEAFYCLELKILSLKARQMLPEAISYILQGFSMLGIHLPERPGKVHLFRLVVETRILFEYRLKKGLDKIPLMQDERLLLLDRLISCSISAIYFYSSSLMPYLVLYQVRNTLKYGINKLSPRTLATYAMVLCGISRKYQKARQLSQFALALGEKQQGIEQYAATRFMTISFVDIWHRPLSELLEPLMETYKEGMRYGSIEFGAYSLSNYSFFSFFSGKPLYQISDDCKQFTRNIFDFRQESTLNFFRLLQQFSDLVLIGDLSAHRIEGDVFNRKQIESIYLQNKDHTGLLILYSFDSLLNLLGSHQQQLKKCYEILHENLEAAFASIFNVFGYYIAALSLVELWPSTVSTKERMVLRRRMNNYLSFLERRAEDAPFNFAHMFWHVRARWFEINDQFERSLMSYEQALDFALRYNRLLEVGMIGEGAASLALDMDLRMKAEFFIQKSYMNYRKWGAKNKAEKVLQELSWRSNVPFAQEHLPFHTTLTRSQGRKADFEFDLASILKASQALSTEIIPAKLVEKLTAILLEAAGASKILLMENNAGNLHFLAEGYIRNNSVWVENYLEENSKLSLKDKQVLFEKNIRLKAPYTLLNYISRTQQVFVEEDLSLSRKFDDDEYVVTFRPKSVLCFPLQYKGQVRNLIYLENNLVQGAFTPDRVSLFETISSQIAISLENSRLYQSLEEKVKERTSEVVKQKEIIEKKNEDITASINYGKRIQEALLPKETQLKRAFDDAFIFFKPRDIVSGDFYWFKETEEHIIMALADCTGHGVPGAFVSLIGHNLLNEIIVQKEERSPARILKLLHHGLNSTLNSKGSNSQDGMDVGLIVVDKNNQQLLYAGAKTPLLYIRDQRLYKIKAERCSLGDDTFPIESFTEHVIDLDTPATFYLFSDGFQDQFGGLKNKKYLTGRLKSFLMKIHDLPLGRQQALLETEFKNWMGAESQVDDVLVIGFTLG